MAISLKLVNDSDQAIDADDIAVTTNVASGAHAIAPARPFKGIIQPRTAQNATYPFVIPADVAKGVLLIVSYRTGAPIATLTI